MHATPRSAALTRVGLPLMAAGVALLGACGTRAPTAAPSPAPARQRAMDRACAPVLQALRAARRQSWVAQYAEDADGRRAGGSPKAWRIGDVVHETEHGRAVARLVPAGRDETADLLQAELERGSAWCESGEPAVYRGLPVTTLRFRHPQLQARHNPTTLLVGRGSGLPLWHGFAGMDGEGYAWVYGCDAGPGTTGPSAGCESAQPLPAPTAGGAGHT